LINLEEITYEDKKMAEEYLNMEIEEMKNIVDFSYDNYKQIYNEVYSNVFYIPDVQKFCHNDEIETQQKFDSYAEIYDIKKNIILKEQNISKKLEDKSNILMGGYFKRLENLQKIYCGFAKEINESKLKYKIYQELKCQEDVSIAKRQNDLQEKINNLKDKEILLQKRYKNFKEFHEEIKNL
jgi:hypothetical protein